MAYLSLGPVSVAVFAALNVAGLQALVGQDADSRYRIYDDVPPAPTFPFVWYEVKEREMGRMGGGGFPEIELRVHVFSTYQGAKEAQAITQKAIELLRDQALTISGYNQAGKVFYDDTQLLNDQIIAGVKCREMVAMFHTFAEESA